MTDGTEREPFFTHELIPENPNGPFLVTWPEVFYESNIYYANRIINTETGEYREFLDFLPYQTLIVGNLLLVVEAEYTDSNSTTPVINNTIAKKSLWLADQNGDNLILLESSEY